MQPELRSFLLRHPQTKNFLVSFQVHAQHHIDGLVLNVTAVADLYPQRIQIHDRIQLLQRAALPCLHFLQHRFSDIGDQRGRDFHVVNFLQVPLDLTRAHAPRIHRDDLVVEAGEALLSLGHDLRLEARLPVARGFQIQLAEVALQRLAAHAIAAVAAAMTRGIVLLESQMIGEFGL